MVRLRATANLCVMAHSYRLAVRRWLAEGSVTDISLKCGPTLVRNARAVTPAMVRHCYVLIEDLMKAGLKSRVIQTCKMEYALKQEMCDNKLLVKDQGNLDSLAHKIAQHVQMIMAMLRNVKREDAGLDSTAACRYPRSVGFRRKMTSEESRVLFWSQYQVHRSPKISPRD